MEPKTGYATSFDGTKLYYESYGQGPVICCCNGIGVSTFFWKYLVEYFDGKHQVILWDYRSHGKSGVAPDFNNLTMRTNARDLKAVLDALGVKEAVLTGHSMGVQTIFEFYRLFPDQTAGLIPVLGSYGRPMDTFLGTDIMAHLFPLTFTVANLFPTLTKKISGLLLNFAFNDEVANIGARAIRFIHWQLFNKEDLLPYVAHMRTLDIIAFLNMAKRMQEHSVKDMLPNIKIPVLIVSGEDDLFTPWEISAEMHRLIPGSELLTIPHGSHAALVEQPELMNLRIEKWILENLSGSAWQNGAGKKKPSAKKTGAPRGRKSAAPKKAAAKKPAAKKPASKKAAQKKTVAKKTKTAKTAPAPAEKPKKAAAKKAAPKKAAKKKAPGKSAAPKTRK